jgi:hypothetical protein
VLTQLQLTNQLDNQSCVPERKSSVKKGSWGERRCSLLLVLSFEDEDRKEREKKEEREKKKVAKKPAKKISFFFAPFSTADRTHFFAVMFTTQI